MPIVEYKCDECHTTFEVIELNYKKVNDQVHCECGGVARKQISRASFKVWEYDMSRKFDPHANARMCGLYDS